MTTSDEDDMKTSENGVAFIKRCEGYISVPRMDTDKLVWGHGHNQLPGEIAPSLHL